MVGLGMGGEARAEDKPITPKLERDGGWDEADGYSTNDSDCKVSAGINGDRYGCGGTRAMIEGAKVTNAVTQAAGQISTAAVGQSQQMNAQAAGGTQSATLHAAAVTQRTTGDIELVTGGLNTGLGLVQMIQYADHKGNAKEIKGGSAEALKAEKKGPQVGDGSLGGQGFVSAATDGGVNDRIVKNFKLNEKYHITTDVVPGPSQAQAQEAARNQEIEMKKGAMKRDTKRIANKAADEQGGMAKEAMAGGMMSIIQGATQMMTGGFNIMSANQLDDTADKLKALENQVPTISPFAPMGARQVGPADALAPAAPTSLNGAGTSDVQAAQDSTPLTPDNGSLGRPIADVPKTGIDPGPAAGKFSSSGPPGGGSGGGGGFNGGASTAPASGGDNADPQAKMADSSKGSGYEGGGYASGGGGGGTPDKGPDLSGLLAQFLPKKDDAQKNPNGIADFGGRGPAGEGPISLLDKNVNIFERIHQTYQDKGRRGTVGI